MSQFKNINLKDNLNISNSFESFLTFIKIKADDSKVRALKNEILALYEKIKTQYNIEDEISQSFILYILVLQNEDNIENYLENINTNQEFFKNKELLLLEKNALLKIIGKIHSGLENQTEGNSNHFIKVEETNGEENAHTQGSVYMKEANSLAIDVITVFKKTEDTLKTHTVLKNALGALYQSFFIVGAVLRGINLIILIIECIIKNKKFKLSAHDYFDLASFVILFGLAIAAVFFIGTIAGSVIGLVTATIFFIRNIKHWIDDRKRYREIEKKLEEKQIAQDELEKIKELISLKQQIEIWEKVQDYIKYSKQINRTNIEDLILLGTKITPTEFDQIGFSGIGELERSQINIVYTMNELKIKYKELKKTSNLEIDTIKDLQSFSIKIAKQQERLKKEHAKLSKEKEQNYHAIDTTAKVLLSATVVAGLIVSAIAFTALSVSTAGIALAIISAALGGIYFARKLYQYFKNKKEAQAEAKEQKQENPQENLIKNRPNIEITEQLSKNNSIVERPNLETQTLTNSNNRNNTKYINRSISKDHHTSFSPLYNPRLALTKIIKEKKEEAPHFSPAHNRKIENHKTTKPSKCYSHHLNSKL